MQITHECDGPGLPDYPENIQPKAVNVWVHGSNMVMTHDYACPVCREKSAVIDGSTGIMQPCWSCQEQGYRLHKAKPKKWWKRLFS